MGLKKLETRQITLQHIQNSDLNELSRNYDIIYKFGQNSIEWVEMTKLRIHMQQYTYKAWVEYCKIYIDIERLICHIDYTVVTDFLAE